MKNIIPPVKGTRDFYPDEMARRSWFYQTIGEVSRRFGYQEYDAPFLERLELYAAKSGEELVKEQAYVFSDRGGEQLALRPELTLSLARMVAQRQKELALPLRWWSFGPFWRYERPQKGRTREFFQWNADLIGPSSPESDAELIALAVEFFRAAGLTPAEVGISINHRKLIHDQLAGLSIPIEQHPSVFRLVDRLEKMRPEEWQAYGAEIGLDEAQRSGILSMLKDRDLWHSSDELRRLHAALQVFGVEEYVDFDPTVVRGLDYYTGTVFEARDRGREGRAIFGGGHYANLVADVGGEPLAGVGFAMGDVMIQLVMEKYGRLPELPTYPAQVLVTVFDEALLATSLSLATDLRAAGLNVVSFTEPVRLQRQLKLADRQGVRFVLIVGPDEAAASQVTLKDLREHTQVTLPSAEAARTILAQLAN